MRTTLFSLGTILAATTLAGIDSGGVSIDLNQIRNHLTIPDENANLIKNGDFEDAAVKFTPDGAVWRGNCRLWMHSNISNRQLQHLTQRENVRGIGVNNSRAARIYTPVILAQKLPEKKLALLTNSLHQSVDLPDTPVPVNYAITFQLCGRLFSPDNQLSPQVPTGSFRLTVDFHGKKPGTNRLQSRRPGINHRLEVPLSWRRQTLRFTAPPHTRKLDIGLVLYGTGQIKIDDVKLFPLPEMPENEVYVHPFSYLDNCYKIGVNTPGVIVFGLHNDAQRAYKALQLHVLIPPGFELLGSNQNARHFAQRKQLDGSVLASFKIQKCVKYIPRNGHQQAGFPAIYLKSKLPASSQRYPLKYFLTNFNWQSKIQTLNLEVIAVKRGVAPQNFISGIRLGDEFDCATPLAPQLKEFLVKSGITAVHHAPTPNLLMELKKVGITRYSDPDFLTNGYQIGGDNSRTKAACFRKIDGRLLKIDHLYTCPTEVYRRGEFFREAIQKLLTKQLNTLDLYDQIMPEWDSQELDQQGCYCDQCREEFIRFMSGQIPAASIRQNWPQRIAQSYPVHWSRFRSWQHAQVCLTLEQEIRKIGAQAGKKSHFIPRLPWNRFGQGRYHNFSYASVWDYLEQLPVIQVSGPTMTNILDGDADCSSRTLLNCFDLGRSIQQQVINQLPPGRRPKLIAALPGTQYAAPEAIAFNLLSCFINRWQGAFITDFPQGGDQRYWNALSQANALIARYEKYVLSGELATSRIKIRPVTPLPPATDYLPQNRQLKFLRHSSQSGTLLQFRAFKSAGQLLIALGNFWPHGEIFAELQVKGLQPDARYHVGCSAGLGLGSFSGNQLKRGILVHVGALRWNFISITHNPLTYDNLSPRDMELLLKQRRPHIEYALRHRQELHKKTPASAPSARLLHDLIALPQLRHQQITLQPVRRDNRSYLEVATPEYQALLDLFKGGTLRSVMRQHHELVLQQNLNGWNFDAFWFPDPAVKIIKQEYKLVDCQPSANGIQVTLKHQITASENQFLSGLTIVKSFTFERRRIVVKSRLINPTHRELKFAFRYNNTPQHLASMQGAAEFGTKAKFERELMLKIARFGKPDRRLDHAYTVGKFINAPQSNLVLRDVGLPDLQVSFPGVRPYGIIFWDSGKFATLEPLFHITKLKPQQTAQYSMIWSW